MEYRDEERKQAFMLVARAGDIILQSGAEIFRVETTMSHMAKALHVEDLETYVIANGIFATAKGEGAQLHAHIKSVETGDTDLGKIEAVNELSRDMEQHAYTLEDVEKRLEEIENMGEYPRFILISAYGMGAGCFCYAFGGSFHDSLVAFVVGLVLGVFFYIIRNSKNMKALKIIAGSMLVTFLASFMYRQGLGDSVDFITIGSLMPMIPGVSFANSIRDFVENDYVSGLIRLMDVLLTAVCMAVGVYIIWDLLIF